MPVHLECGARNAIAFVLSCPGSQEQSRGHPAAGPTGRNLEDVLCFMRGNSYDGIDGIVSDDWTRENILITNAWSHVESDAQTGRSEADIPEVLVEHNVRRLGGELNAIRKLIVCCGTRASEVVRQLRDRGCLADGVSVLSLGHLSNRALNTWIPNRDLPGRILRGAVGRRAQGRRRRRERIRRWASCLYRQVSAVMGRDTTQ